MLDGEATEVHGVGFAGVKGFAGGFGRGALGPWGEHAIKAFVQEAVDEALKLEARSRGFARRSASRCCTTRRFVRPWKASRPKSSPISVEPSRRTDQPLPRQRRLSRPRASRHAGRPDVDRRSGA